MQIKARIDQAQMASPSAGFASRVMARIEERERAQARRRTAIGVGLIALVVISLFALVALWVAAWLSALLGSPGAIVTALLTVSPLAGDWLDAV
ncbi:MAG TPA: hypothetical protein VF478_11970, partial [Anaerolineae bacterium]